jgi:hypothetical protein
VSAHRGFPFVPLQPDPRETAHLAMNVICGKAEIGKRLLVVVPFVNIVQFAEPFVSFDGETRRRMSYHVCAIFVSIGMID